MKTYNLQLTTDNRQLTTVSEEKKGTDAMHRVSTKTNHHSLITNH